MNICIVTPDIIGPIRNGGIGTAYYNLALFLKRSGYNVTILYTLNGYSEYPDKPMPYWVDYYEREYSIKFIPLYYETGAFEHESMSIAIFEWLKQNNNFDFVHFPEWRGNAYHTLQNKKLFKNTEFIVETHSPTLWHFYGDGGVNPTNDMIRTDEMERFTVSHADKVISPSRYMLDWMQQNNWKICLDNQVIPNLIEAGYNNSTPPIHSHKINEIVLFGRLELRKGVDIFCDAIKAINNKEIAVTFLGKNSLINGQKSSDVITEWLKETDIKWQIIDNLNSKEAIDYLKQLGRLAVIASKVENYPYAVLECIHAGVNFICSDSGGTKEMFLTDELLFKPTAEELKNNILKAINENHHNSGNIKGSYNLDHVKQLWLKAHHRDKLDSLKLWFKRFL